MPSALTGLKCRRRPQEMRCSNGGIVAVGIPRWICRESLSYTGSTFIRGDSVMTLRAQFGRSALLMAIFALSSGICGAEELVIAAIQHVAQAGDSAHAGIWKVATPAPGTMHGGFASNDRIGIAAGVKSGADCSLNWKGPDSGKLYRRFSATSLVPFLDSPHVV
jgi:hypothetical protein